VLAQIAFDERRLDPRRADAVAADAALHVVHAIDIVIVSTAPFVIE
jgi:hypothetical protein